MLRFSNAFFINQQKQHLSFEEPLTHFSPLTNIKFLKCIIPWDCYNFLWNFQMLKCISIRSLRCTNKDTRKLMLNISQRSLKIHLLHFDVFKVFFFLKWDIWSGIFLFFSISLYFFLMAISISVLTFLKYEIFLKKKLQPQSNANRKSKIITG